MYATLTTVRPEDQSSLKGWKGGHSCTNDGGRPAGTAVQAEVPNHLEVLWSKAMVLSVKEKAASKLSGVHEEDE